MKICKKFKKQFTFNEYTYSEVIWSDDKLPHCPICGMSPHDADFKKTHGNLYNEDTDDDDE